MLGVEIGRQHEVAAGGEVGELLVGPAMVGLHAVGEALHQVAGGRRVGQLAEVTAVALERTAQRRGVSRAQHEGEHVDAPVVPLRPQALGQHEVELLRPHPQPRRGRQIARRRLIPHPALAPGDGAHGLGAAAEIGRHGGEPLLAVLEAVTDIGLEFRRDIETARAFLARGLLAHGRGSL